MKKLLRVRRLVEWLAMDDLIANSITRAAKVVREADAIVVLAGAGMGVDSGLPDFRGDEGFWKAYPPYQRLGLGFTDLAMAGGFEADPGLAWGFYGHRLALYRRTVAHAGYEVLLKWARSKLLGYFVFTSNVDGQFERAGFATDRIVECHGSIHHMQCVAACDGSIWNADGVKVEVDLETMRAQEPWPQCISCGGMARPNILMFGDSDWVDARSSAQERRYSAWLKGLKAGARVVAVECGAGTAIPTVRLEGERVARRTRGTLVRINVREAQTLRLAIGISMGARDALERIDREVERLV